MSIHIEQVKTGAFTMRFFRFGHGTKPFVMLPGLSVQSVMNAADLIADAYQPMADDFTVYVFDRREDLPPTYTVADMARDTAEAMKALGLRDVYLFGASQGGMIALEMAIKHPELVARMVLGSTSARVSDTEFAALKRWIRLAKAQDGVGLYEAFGEAIYPPAVLEASREMLVAAGQAVTEADLTRFITLTKGTAGFDVLDALPLIRCPVLVLGAEDDAVLGADATRQIAEKLGNRPDFECHLYRGYGHAAFDTAPDYKERILRFFLA
ncbi:MAG: alpha/beta hydrolase [Clostridia bacterium]|nr:alpha/beta hydrolase [Clostridia bacterium]